MKKISLFLFFAYFLSLNVYSQYHPHKDLGALFTDVQLKPVFSDSKTFVDAIPKFPVAEIIKKYNKAKAKKGFDLKTFVHENFIVPEKTDAPHAETFPPIEVHIDDLWETLVRTDSIETSSLIKLPNSYIVPGGRFNEMYYWDTYFTMLGLEISEKDQLMEDMVDNFAWLIENYGFIPNGTRTYYLSRSQPPYFSLMVELLAATTKEEALVDYLPALVAEHNFWMKGLEDLHETRKSKARVVRMDDGSYLNRYWDNDSTPRPEAYKEDIETASKIDIKPERTYRNIRAAAESGWDFSARWFKDGITLKTIQTTDIIPVDLNSLLYNLEIVIAKAYAMKGEEKNSSDFTEKAQARKKAILKYCWDAENEFFMDYNFKEGRSTGFFSLAGMSPLFFQIAGEAQAAAVASYIEDYFLFPGGIPSTLLLSGQQWDAPNGWAPLQWISYKGLKNYNFDELATTLKERWLQTIENEYRESGKLLEKYNVIFPEIPGGGGEYPTQDGFGWTNGVYLKMLQED